jgi:hypothetical protein
VERSSGSRGSQCEDLGLPLQGFSMSAWQQHVATLEAAVEPAKDANVSVTKVSLWFVLPKVAMPDITSGLLHAPWSVCLRSSLLKSVTLAVDIQHAL